LVFIEDGIALEVANDAAGRRSESSNRPVFPRVLFAVRLPITKGTAIEASMPDLARHSVRAERRFDSAAGKRCTQLRQ